MHEAMVPHAAGGVYANFVPEADGGLSIIPRNAGELGRRTCHTRRV